jgi:mRNA interferase RelE/StbE
MTGPRYTIVWREPAVKMAETITDRRERERIVARVDQLAENPEQQGKPFVGELAGYRSVRVAGQRYRIIYRVERQTVIVLIVAVGRRKEGDQRDIYALARKLFRQKLL